MTKRPELYKEAFLAFAAQRGLDPNDPHMDDLYPEVKGLLQRLATLDQELTGSWPCAPLDKFLHKVRSRWIVWPSGPDQGRYVLHDVLADRHIADQLLQVDNRLG